MAIPTNPYIAGNPVGNTDAFVGREDVQREVLHMLRHPQQNAISLYGQRRIGKTSVLQSLMKLLPQEGNYRPVFFDLEDRAALPLARVLSELARVMAHELDLQTPELGNDPEKAFKNEWLPGVLAAIPVETCLVLLFDEFDVLADPKAGSAAAAFFPYLRDLLALDRTRLQFVFVLGRSPKDLSSIALSVFKGISSQRITLLSEENAEKLIRISERDKSLMWSKEAIRAIWQLTHGHPFLTQSLCSQIWERVHEETNTPPVVTAQSVQDAVETTLESSRNTLEWLWDGLGPAERIVAAALAQAGPVAVDEVTLARILQEGGVRIIIRELQNAPQLLQDWDLLEPAKEGYQFRVELLRQWIEENRPLRRVQQEIDRVQPRAENLYNVAVGYYEDGDAKEAENMLLQSLRANPSHIRANELLSELLITQGRFDEAQKLLEELIEIAPSVARPRLVQIYLSRAEQHKTDPERLTFFEKILQLDSTNPLALERRQEITVNREFVKIKKLESDGLFDEAVELVHRLAKEFPTANPNGESWNNILNSYEIRTQLEQNYQLAQSALKGKNNTVAIKHALLVLMLDVTYKDTTAILHEAVTGDNLGQLKTLADAYMRDRLIPSKSKQIRRGSTPQPESNGKRITSLRSGNPLHQFWALLWAYFSPSRLQKYADEHHDHTVVEIASWGVAHLMWLPIVLLFAALHLKASALVASSVSSDVTLYLTVPVFLGAVLSVFARWLESSNDFVSFGYVFLAIALACVTGLSLLFGILHTSPGNLLLGGLIVVIWSLAIVAAYVGTKEESVIDIKDPEEKKLTFHSIGTNIPFLLSMVCFWFVALTFAIGYVTLKSNGGALEFLTSFLSPFLLIGIFFFITFIISKGEKVVQKNMLIFLGLSIIVAAIPSGVFYVVTQRLVSSSIRSFITIFLWNWAALFGTILLSALIGYIGYLLSRRVWLTRFAFVLLLIAIVLMVGILFFDAMSLLGVEAAQLTPPTATLPATLPSDTRSADQMTMIKIPAGTVVMGDNPVDNKYSVSLSTYWIDKTEVTNSMYARCVESGKCNLPRDTTYYDDVAYQAHPVVYVNWVQASSYCDWAGARLPTEAEWEFAAKGVDALKYPWGNFWDCSLANTSNYSQTGCDRYLGTALVGSFPDGASPFGILDMSGNAYEWVQDSYAAYPEGSYINADGPDSADRKVLRGGSLHDSSEYLMTTKRASASSLASAYNFGFRCADSANP